MHQFVDLFIKVFVFIKKHFREAIDWGAWISLVFGWLFNLDNIKGVVMFILGVIASIYLILYNRQRLINEKKRGHD